MSDYAYMTDKLASIHQSPTVEEQLRAMTHRLNIKRVAAKEWMGERYIMHPKYVYQPRHAWRVVK